MARRKKNRRATLFLALLFLIIILISGIIVLIGQQSGSKTKADLDAIYSMDLDTNTVTNSAVLLNNELIATRAISSDGGIYLNIDFIQNMINDAFYWEPSSDLLIYTTPSEVIKVSVGDSNYYVGNTQTPFERVILKEAGDSVYVSADFVMQYSAMDYGFYENPNRVLVFTDFGTEHTKISIKKNTSLRVSSDLKSDVVASLEKDSTLTLLDSPDGTEEGWVYAITDDGLFGYLQEKYLGGSYTESRTTEYTAPVYPSDSRSDNINMVWHQVTNQTANRLLEDVLYYASGLTVISPTWFYLDDDFGNIANLASTDYVTYSHQNGMEVWALISNFENSSVDTTAVLCNTENREHLESQLISAAIEYKLDGINLDFEDIPAECGEGFVQFVRELSILCHKNGIILSVDVYPPAAYNSYYGYQTLGTVADYVILMAYDEHYSGSSAGSVSSIGWVEEGITNCLKEIPAEKLILGLPFYTRLWETTSDGSVTCTNMSMSDSWNWVDNNGLEASWNDETGQYYASDIQGNSIFEIWLEDTTSLEKKVLLARNYQLAGTSAWKLTMEKNDVWDILKK